MSRPLRFALGLGALLLALFAATYLYQTRAQRAADARAAEIGRVLAPDHAPTMGPRDAKVHIVEFLDPACGACAAFYPHVKKLVEAHPGKVRLTIRHVLFHDGSEHAVRMLEAARAQGKYWELLEALLARNGHWVVQQRVDPQRLAAVLPAAGMEFERTRRDMDTPEVVRRINQDMRTADALKIDRTPAFFVNGRPLRRLGVEELQGLVADELRKAYPGGP